MKKKTRQSVEEFLASRTHDPRWRGGHRCKTCVHPEAEAINHDIRAYFEAAKNSHGMPWTRFVRERIEPEYAVGVQPGAVMHHAIKCLRVTP